MCPLYDGCRYLLKENTIRGRSIHLDVPTCTVRVILIGGVVACVLSSLLAALWSLGMPLGMPGAAQRVGDGNDATWGALARTWGASVLWGSGLATLLTCAAIWSLAARRWRPLALLCGGAGVTSIAFAAAANVFPTWFPGTDGRPLPAIVSRATVEHVFVVAIWDPTRERSPVLGGVPAAVVAVAGGVGAVCWVRGAALTGR
jgi:hypothetical protein